MKSNPFQNLFGGWFRQGGAIWLLPLLICTLFLCSGCVESDSDSVDGDSDSIDSDIEIGDIEIENDAQQRCRNADCPDHACCNPETGECECELGYEPLGGRCVVVVEDGDLDSEQGDEVIDGDLDSDLVSDGDSTDTDVDGSSDGDIETDVDNDIDGDTDGDGEAETLLLCEVPQAPTMTVIHKGAELSFTCASAGAIQVGKASSPSATEPDAWLDQDSLAFENTGAFKIFARLVSDECEPQPFVFTYDVEETFPPASGQDGSTAVSKDDTSILGWATGVESVTYGENVTEGWQTPDKALGAAEGTSFDIVSLGRGGEITLSFDPPIANRSGYDFTVFENSFSDTFLEVAYVEISSDNETFLRFDSAYLGESEVSGFGNTDTVLFDGLAGKYRQGYGNPFDLEVFVNRPEVRDGSVDLDAIRYVRFVDIVGDGSAMDSFGHVIYDPYPTTDSAGFDLDAVGVLNQ